MYIYIYIDEIFCCYELRTILAISYEVGIHTAHLSQPPKGNSLRIDRELKPLLEEWLLKVNGNPW